MAKTKHNTSHNTREVDKRIAELTQILQGHDYQYYVLNKSSLTDSEYDLHFQELQQLEQKYPELIRPDSPSQRVGSDLTNDFPEATHSTPVLSLDKAYSYAEIHKWIGRVSKGITTPFHLVIEEKMDGSSLVLYYREGMLTQALTRGNGEVGNDITQNVKTIHSVPLRLTSPRTAAIRGEVFMALSDFVEMNREQSIEYSNPRNFASGSLRRIKSAEVARIPLRFFAYEPFGDGFNNSHSENIAQLTELGLAVNPHQKRIVVDPRNESLLDKAFEEIEQFLVLSAAYRQDLDYEIDGMVIKIDEILMRAQLGYTDHHPRWALAWKFESPQGSTKVHSIDLQIGRTGRVTPMARVEAVSVGGTSIQNITLHNQAYIETLGLAAGDTVAVSRRGDVIPAIEQVLEKGRQLEWQMPALCPACSNMLEKRGAHHFCPNFNCPARQKGRLAFFTGRDQMDIENLGAETISTLICEGIIHDIPDIFRLDYARIARLPGFGEKKVALIRSGVEKAQKQSYRRIMVSLGIIDFGPKLAELLEDNGYLSIDALFSLIDEGAEEKLAEIKGIGKKTVETVAWQLRDGRFRTMVAELKKLDLNFSTQKQQASTLPPLFHGQRWCVTGSFEHFKPRSLAIEAIKKRSGEIVSDVSSKTTHLLAGSSAGSKFDKAQKFGIIIVDEQKFRDLLG